jgi:mRNA interferase MazF
MVSAINPPQRGDVVWLDFDPQTGREQSGRRPALVLSDARYNHLTGRAVFCPITSKVKGYPFEVPISCGGVSGVVLSDHVKNLDWRARKLEFSGSKADSETLRSVLANISLLIGI